MQFGWSVLAQKLPQWTLKAISDQLISDHWVVGFSPEAHPMDPEKAFPTDSFPTTMWSFLQLGPTAEPWTSLPTNTFPTVIGRFWDNPRVWHVNGGPDLSDTIHVYMDMETHFRPTESVGLITHFGPIRHFRLGLKGPTWSVGGRKWPQNRPILFISDRFWRSEMPAFLVVKFFITTTHWDIRTIVTVE